ncbi:tartrate-resistant acid phosphatase type 5-like isoform X2 [Amphiura filiformis]|uniref:tartrate-resistant acid phosphatase type 5-like isoform X2 n=1 Tax=Amphiura filiformis TaxID=82378 RepID=UPI003B21A178
MATYLHVVVFLWMCAVNLARPSTTTGKSLHFMVLGDWGGIPIYPYYTPDEVAVAKQMSIIAENINASFVMALGDNFYENGVTDVNDKRFQDTYENVFKAKSLQIPWNVLAGNHDHYGNVTAQIAYTQKSKRWNFPSLYYTQKYTIPGSNASVALVMIDTVTLCGNTHDNVLISIPPQGPENPKHAEDQWAWIEKQLQDTIKDEYVIVAGHFPVWSIAEHGPTKCLVDRLKPLLEKYNVNAYFCGHDHNLQHLREPGSSVEYFVIGAAHIVENSTEHKKSVPKNSLQFYYAEESKLGGFAYVQERESELHFVFANGLDSKDIYHAIIKPRSFYSVRNTSMKSTQL